VTRVLAVAVCLASVGPRNVLAQCPDGSPPPCRSAVRPPPPPTSVAVLYFDNASHDSNDVFLADGLTEAVIAQLGQVERLSVMSRSAVRRFRSGGIPEPSAIARTLNVAYLVTGSVQRSGHRLRVSIDLARAKTGVRMWGDQFIQSDESLFVLQDDIARRVAEGVAGRLLASERRSVTATRVTRNPEAYEHFLRGNYYLAQRTSTGMVRATTEYRRATALDSAFVSALARVGLAYALRLQYSWDSAGAPAADSLLTQGLIAADQALKRDSLNSDAWLARGYLLQFKNPRTWDGVVAAFQRAVLLDSTNAEAWQQLGDAGTMMADESTAVIGIRRAMAIDPARPVTLRRYSRLVLSPESGRLLDSAIAVDPGFLLTYYSRGLTRFDAGDTTGARIDLESVKCTACPADMRPRFVGLRAAALQWTGDTNEARLEAERVLSWLRPIGSLSTGAAIPLAWYFDAVDDTNRVLDLLERIEPRGVDLWQNLINDPFKTVANNPRFQRVLNDARPPWAPPEVAVLDLPIPPETRSRLVGQFAGPVGLRRVIARGDSLFLEIENQQAGRLLLSGRR